jgi:molecular chaperone GrpE
MTRKNKSFNEDSEPTEEIIMTDATKEPSREESDELFEVSEASKGKNSEDETERFNADTLKTAVSAEPANEPGEAQDALFEVNAAAKGDPCDDEPRADSPVKEKVEKEKKEPSPDKKKIDELASQLEAANDKYLRLMAEFDNFKRRSAKEFERLIEAANERLIKDITEVRENFERAFKSNAEGEKLLEGMRLIFTKLNDILRKHGLEVYAEAGQKFDPGVHDALMRAPHESIAEDHIVEVHERGYKLKGNIIKHAKVIVSSGKPAPKESDNETVIEIK